VNKKTKYTKSHSFKLSGFFYFLRPIKGDKFIPVDSVNVQPVTFSSSGESFTFLLPIVNLEFANSLEMDNSVVICN